MQLETQWHIILIILFTVISNIVARYKYALLILWYSSSSYCSLAQTMYNGPETSNYFREAFTAPISSLPDLECNAAHYQATNSTNLVHYFKINVTAEMKQKYGIIELSTCCELDTYSNSYCNTTSLDTNLYILYEKKGQINLLETSDDVDPEICQNEHKSFLNLVNYPNGLYIIAVGGYAQEAGKYHLKLKCQSDSSTYNGPVTNEWFREQIILIPELPELACVFATEWEFDPNATTIDDAVKVANQFATSTDAYDLVKYYMLNITTEMKQTFSSSLFITTCCAFDACEALFSQYTTLYGQDLNNTALDECDESLFEVLVWGQVGFSYQDHCTSDSVDTYLYILQEKRGQFNLVEAVDDTVSCSNTQKSQIDLSTYEEGVYVVAVGGYGKDYGSFFLQIDCIQYSWPMPEDQVNPSSSSALYCNQSLPNELTTEQRHVSYYDLTITADTYPPIVIVTQGTNVDVYVFKLKDNEYEMRCSGYTYDPLCDVYKYNDSDTMVTVIYPRNVTDFGTYTVVVQGIFNLPVDYSISTMCGDPPTYSPSNVPTFHPTVDPTRAPTATPTPAPTLRYSWPIKKAEFLIPDNALTLTCNQRISNQSDTANHSVSYYRFSIVSEISPMFVSTCPAPETIDDTTSIYDTYMYIIQDYGDIITVLDESDIASCDDKSAEIDISSYSIGEYVAVVQGYENALGNFSIVMQCTEPLPKVSRQFVMSLVFGLCGLTTVLFVVYYCYRWREYIRNKPKMQKKTTARSHTLLAQEADSESDGEENATNVSSTELQPISIQTQELKDENDANIFENAETIHFHHSRFSELKIRLFDNDRSVVEQLHKDEDVVQLVLAHAIQCCEDQQGVDVYQLLAIQYYDPESRNVRGVRPFYAIGINTEFIVLSPFFQTVWIGSVCALAQTMGISIVVYKLFYAYFEQSEGFTAEICVMDAMRWRNVYSLKMLSFLLSMVITFYIGIVLTNIQHAGLYESLSRLEPKHMTRINEKHEAHEFQADNHKIWLGALFIGQTINYYVCLLAVIGSYFIIFSSNKGDQSEGNKIDYSDAGLDMILNAVALFFMLDLDNMMVSVQNYNDCKQHLEGILDVYVVNEAINKDYDKTYIDTHCRCVCECKYNKKTCCLNSAYRLVAIFSLFVKICCYGGGFVAPFVIFFCW